MKGWTYANGWPMVDCVQIKNKQTKKTLSSEMVPKITVAISAILNQRSFILEYVEVLPWTLLLELSTELETRLSPIYPAPRWLAYSMCHPLSTVTIQ